MRQKPKVLILGYGRHGKDTVAELLRDRHGFTFVSSSYFAASRVMLPYYRSRAIFYEDADHCFSDRHRLTNRATWKQQISFYNTPDKTRLCREIIAENDIYVGMRCEKELAATRKLFDYVLWVDASERGIPPEDASSCTVAYDRRTHLIRNNGTLGDLTLAVDRMAIAMLS